MVTREQVVSKAREYADTPFCHQARIKGKSVDCVGLVLCVSEDLKLIDRQGKPLQRQDRIDYSAQPTDGEVHQTCRLRMVQKSFADLKPGDVVSLKLPMQPCHVGIVTIVSKQLGTYIIHAYSGGKHKVVEHVLDHKWQKRLVGAFSFPGVE